MPPRIPASTIVFTAIAATIVLLPGAIGPAPDKAGEPLSADKTQLTQQHLNGLGGGTTIREVSQRTPFSMVALTGTDLAGTSARVRAERPDESWGPWYDIEYEAETVESDGSDGLAGSSHRLRGTEPVFVGRTTTVQIAVKRPSGAPVKAPPTRTPAGPRLGYKPATAEHPLARDISAVLISPPQSPVDGGWTPPSAVTPPGRPPNIISRAQWGAGEPARCAHPPYGHGIRAAVIHHTAGSNDYEPQDSAEIVQAIYAYHTRTLGWCDIAYNALVDRYGQVFEGRAGGIAKPVEGDHTGGFNGDTWGIAMIGTFDDVPPTPIQLRTVGRLLGWRLGIDGVNPRGVATLTSEGGAYTTFPRGATPTLPAIFTHRDVGNTDCPGNAAYSLMDEIRDIARRFNEAPGREELIASLEGGAIYARWQQLGGPNSVLGRPTSPESMAAGSARYVTFDKGAMYWSPETGAQPLNGAIYDAWASLGYERGALGLPTSAEIQEPEWVVQNFRHGTLNFDRLTGKVTRVMNGVVLQLPPPAPSGPPMQLERFSPPISPAV